MSAKSLGPAVTDTLYVCVCVRGAGRWELAPEGWRWWLGDSGGHFSEWKFSGVGILGALWLDLDSLEEYAAETLWRKWLVSLQVKSHLPS